MPGDAAATAPDDREAITDLLIEYAERIDAGDLAGMAALFADATYRTAGTDIVLQGADEVGRVQEHLVRRYDGSPRTRHLVANVRVALDGDRATSRSAFLVLFTPPDGEPRIVVSGRYHDAFERVDGTWRFADRLIHLDHVGDLSGHLHLDRLGGVL